ncbi:hypothetical protein C1886_21285 [Pseudomonas sp. FW300-N1A1]|uniref:hypothetical protein n=1 Tax=Pseudomonas sp. FW300-N1A1 TaxID=2075555 RepID=UPI000CD24650|nr:hypothetical protein [Pseudomonas sp. FW300-N1A1]POA17587.1 hypothetical protein C1886_21285 [Pseudomonas sp. FW300-N1A1]
MTRTCIYDRISAKRIAREEAARLEQQAASIIVPEPEPEPEAVVPLQETPSSFTFGGFNLAFAAGYRFRDIQVTLEHEGEPIVLTINRRDVQLGQTLEALFETSVQGYRTLYPELRIIRQRDGRVAGSAAKSLDFHFKTGHADRHGRLVGAIVPVAGNDDVQWLSISCAIDPTRPVLSHWLLDFDSMLDGLVIG